jgi:hypothetical protein
MPRYDLGYLLEKSQDFGTKPQIKVCFYKAISKYVVLFR